MKILLYFLLVLIFATNIYGQNLFKDYTLNDTIRGEKLTLGTNNIGYQHNSENGNYINFGVNSIYNKWKFTPTSQYFLQANAYTSYTRLNYYDPTIIERGESFSRDYEYSFSNFVYLAAGGSHYFKPNSVYLSVAASTELRTENNNYNGDNGYSSIKGQGFLWTGLGYGRINNAEGLERAQVVSEILFKKNIITKKLSQQTLKELDKKLFEFRNGNYLNDYLDDESIIFMKDAEAILIKNNELNKSLDAESSVRLLQTLLNTSKRYYFYPRYIGYQLDAQLQTQVFSDVKPKENYLKFSGVYGLPVSNKTNLLFTTSYRYMLNNDARGFMNWFPNYYSFYGLLSDYNNVQFNVPHRGLGVLSSSGYEDLRGHKSQISVAINATHSLNSTAGLSLIAQFYYYPAISENDNINYYYYNPTINEYYYNISGRLDYNIYSQLFSHIRAGYGEDNKRNAFSVTIDFDYIIF